MHAIKTVVRVSLCLVGLLAANVAGAETKTYSGATKGDWSVDENWTPAGVPSAGDDVVISDKAVTLNGAAAVASLTLEAGATLTVQAAPSASPALADLYANATIVNVTGLLKVAEGATLAPACDPATGAAVFFKVGSFTLEAGGRVNADDAGYAWQSGTAPSGATVSGSYWTWAPDCSTGDANGASHGGKASSGNKKTYGWKYAPHFAGSPSWWYYSDSHVPGGGVVAIWSSGAMSIAGVVSANANRSGRKGSAITPSGGSVWLAGGTVAVRADARVTANGSSSLKAGGGGGRVSFAVGLSFAELASLTDGSSPADFSYAEEVSGFWCVALGGYYSAFPLLRAGDGSVTCVTKGASALSVEPAPVAPVPLPDTCDGEAKVYVGENGGDWCVSENWSPVGVPCANDEVTIQGRSVRLNRGAEVKSLTLAVGSTLHVTATNVAAVSDYEIYAGATWLRVAGALALTGDAKLEVENDPQSGAPVRVDVGSFALGESATVSATALGWAWTKWDPTTPPPVGAKIVERLTMTETHFYAGYSPGTGFQVGPGYGGASCNVSGKHGVAYGSAFAPFLSGAAGSTYNTTAARAGGTVFVRSRGLVTLDGKITADGEPKANYTGSTGGGIWIIGKSFLFGDKAWLSAQGKSTGNYTYGPGGGRIALAEGLSAANIDDFAKGLTAEELGIASEELTGVAFDVSGGPGSGVRGNPGTAVMVHGEFADIQVAFVNDPAVDVVSDPSGVGVFEPGTEQTFYASADHGDRGLSRDGKSRYPCLGYVVSNQTEEIARGTDSSVTLTLSNSPLTVTWLWGNSDCSVAVVVPEHCSVRAGEILSAEDFSVWHGDGETLTLEVVPDDGYEFVSWTGTVPPASLFVNPFVTSEVATRKLEPVVLPAGSSTARTYLGGDWNDPASWDPEGVPDEADRLTLDGTSLTVTQSVTAVSLTLRNGASLVVQAPASSGAVEDLYDAALTVKVYGTMTVGAGCTVRPYCHVTTGTPVFFECGSFVLEEGAHFNASSAGYGWVAGTAPAGSVSQGGYYTFAPGAALGFANVATFDYVNAIAPFVPGSPMHTYSSNAGRGGGVAKIKAGVLTVRGVISANGDGGDWSSSTGGSIWLAGETVVFGPNAALCARGGNCNNNSTTGVGGAVSVCVGLTDEVLTSLMAGTVPIGVMAAKTLPGVDVRITGGYAKANDSSRFRGPSGSLSVVTMGTAAPTVEPKLPATPAVGVFGAGSVETVLEDDGAALTATADDGASFVGWYGDFTGRRQTEIALTVPTDRTRRIWAVFTTAGVARAFVGTNGSDWSDPGNWSPTGVPGPGDDVTIESGTVAATNALAVKSLTMTGGTLTLTDAPAVVLGDCALSGAAKLSVRAMESAATTWPDLFADAMPFEVAGKMTLADTASVCPCDARVSGAAVCFRVGSLDVGVSAKFDATYGGCDFHLVSDPRGEDPRFRYLQHRGTSWYYSLVGNTGTSHTAGPGYGGNAKGRTNSTYGYPYAPYLSGGHGGVTYNWPSVCGGGVVLIRAAGKVDLKGTLRSNGNARNVQYVGSTGGSVWVIAKGFTAAPTALVEAKGDAVHYNTFGPGGGRVSVATGVSDEEVDALVRGEMPPDVTAGELTSVAYNVDPSYGSVVSGDKTVNMGQPGTATSVTGTHGDTPVLVTGSPVSGVVGVEPSGAQSFEQGSAQHFTAPVYGVLEADSLTRFRCAGYVVSNLTSCVAHGDGCAFDLEIGPDPLTVIWQWTDEQKGVEVAVPDGCVISVGGEMHAEDFTCWQLKTGSVSLQVEPEDGYEFLYWLGDYPYGQAFANPLVVDRAAVRSVHPVVRRVEPRTTRTYRGGDWWSPESWEPANVPGMDDDVVIVNRTVGELNTVAVGSLSLGQKGELDLTGTSDWESLVLKTARDLAVTNNSRLVVGKQRQRAHAVVDVGGNFIISGQERDSVSKVRLYGGVMADAFTNETGCGSVNVGGTLSVGAGCRVQPISEAYTGGSLVFTVGKLQVETGGSIDATGCGFRQVTSETPSSIAPGTGTDFKYGGGYGGRGGFDSSLKPEDRYPRFLGQVYGSAYAPVDAGSCSGEYFGNNGVGGGLIRVHAGRIDLAGKLLADGTSGYGSGSGGGIWLTARSYKFRPGAVLSACGANNYGGGGGGRIAIWRKADADLIARLAAGEQPTSDYLQPRDIEAFNVAFPGVTVKVLGGQQGKSMVAEDGSFGWFPVQQGLLLQVK